MSLIFWDTAFISLRFSVTSTFSRTCLAMSSDALFRNRRRSTSRMSCLRSPSSFRNVSSAKSPDARVVPELFQDCREHMRDRSFPHSRANRSGSKSGLIA